MGMSLEGHLIDVLLVAVVVRQLRGRRLTAVGLLWPIPLVVWAGAKYLHDVPTQGHDVALVAAGAAVGLTLGISCAALTTVRRRPGGAVIAKATGPAAVLWVLGTGSRLAFGVYATHGGAPAIARFSVDHQITGSSTWAATLLLMALSEVLVRAATLGVRAHRTTTSSPTIRHLDDA